MRHELKFLFRSSAQKEAELNDDDNDELQQIFDSYDKDKNGQLDKNELQAFMLDANILSRSDPANYNRDLVYAIIQDADGDKDGRISYEEFKKYNSKWAQRENTFCCWQKKNWMN